MKQLLTLSVVVFTCLILLSSVHVISAEEKEAPTQEEPMKEEAIQEETTQEKESVQAASFTIARMVLCENVENHEPVGVAEVFPVDTPKAYAYLEAVDIAEDTTVSFVWHYEENQVAKVDLTLRKGSRWRTYASKNIATLKGDWKVELRDAGGNVLKAIAFRVE